MKNLWYSIVDIWDAISPFVLILIFNLVILILGRIFSPPLFYKTFPWGYMLMIGYLIANLISAISTMFPFNYQNQKMSMISQIEHNILYGTATIWVRLFKFFQTFLLNLIYPFSINLWVQSIVFTVLYLIFRKIV